MCSIVQQVGQTTRVTASSFSVLVAHALEVSETLTAVLADPAFAGELGGIPADALASLATSLHVASDRSAAAATVVTGQLQVTTVSTAGRLVGGKYASIRRFLEVEAGLSEHGARAVVGRACDLRDDYACVADAWLAGEVSGDAVREMTLGIRRALRHVPLADRATARDLAVATVLPVAKVGTVNDVKRVLARLNLILDPDSASQAAMDAYDDQTLTCEPVGAMSRITAWLTHEAAAAVMTVLGAKVDTVLRTGETTAQDTTEGATESAAPDGVDPESHAGRRAARQHRTHLLAVMLGETMTGLLDDTRVGSHHGAAPHVTLTLDTATMAAGLGGELTMPGSDEPVILPTESIRRILCDANLTPVAVRRLTNVDPATCERDLATLLAEAAVEVLYVGRTQRTVTPRMRRALETRDRHCVFPNCRAHARRCHAHHVTEWENGGATDVDNLALLCVRHHHAVHEGHWRITPTPGSSPHQTGHWTLHPPPPPPRR
jgi:hypothetical protein